MDNQQMKILGIVSLVLCLVCVFVAVERYNANAKTVNAMNQMRQIIPIGELMPGMQQQLKPAVPAASKYAGFFAILTGIAGVILLVKAGTGVTNISSNQTTG